MESQAAVMLGRPQGIPYHEVDAEVLHHSRLSKEIGVRQCIQLPRLTLVNAVSYGYRRLLYYGVCHLR